MRFRAYSLEFRVWGLGLTVHDSGLNVESLRLRVIYIKGRREGGREVL